MTSAKPKYIRSFFSSKTSLLTRLAVILLFVHFVFTFPQKISFPEYFGFYLSEIGDLAYLPGFLTLSTTFLAWLSTLATVLLSTFGRKNLGFLFALVAILLSVIAFLLVGGLDLGWIISNFLEIEPVGYLWLLSTYLVFPVGLGLLILGRPEVSRFLEHRFRKSPK